MADTMVQTIKDVGALVFVNELLSNCFNLLFSTKGQIY